MGKLEDETKGTDRKLSYGSQEGVAAWNSTTQHFVRSKQVCSFLKLELGPIEEHLEPFGF